MTSSDVSVILVKLEHLSDLLDQVHEQVKATNGRVTELEKEQAWRAGNKHAFRPVNMIITTIIAYTTISFITWFLIGKA